MLDADIYEEEDCAPSSAAGLYLADNLSHGDARFLLERVGREGGMGVRACVVVLARAGG